MIMATMTISAMPVSELMGRTDQSVHVGVFQKMRMPNQCNSAFSGVNEPQA